MRTSRFRITSSRSRFTLAETRPIPSPPPLSSHKRSAQLRCRTGPPLVSLEHPVYTPFTPSKSITSHPASNKYLQHLLVQLRVGFLKRFQSHHSSSPVYPAVRFHLGVGTARKNFLLRGSTLLTTLKFLWMQKSMHLPSWVLGGICRETSSAMSSRREES
jgi:hypothetical protein